MSTPKRLRLTLGITLLGILFAFFFLQYKTMIVRNRENVLQLNLTTMRSTIKQYAKDKQRPPRSLQDLVEAGYFRELPIDPITDSNSSWQPIVENVAVSPGQTLTAVTNLRSGATGISSTGTPYSSW